MPADDIGIDFRATAGYVTDPANCTYCLGTAGGDAYPTTRGGYTFGWDPFGAGQTVSAADRTTGQDARLAGINFSGQSGAVRFQLDLHSSGDHLVYLAIGDFAGGTSQTRILVFSDAGTTTIDQVSTTANSFTDATAHEYTAAAWPGSESPITLTFVADTFIGIDVRAIDGTSAFSGLAHLRIVDAPSGAGFLLVAN